MNLHKQPPEPSADDYDLVRTEVPPPVPSRSRQPAGLYIAAAVLVLAAAAAWLVVNRNDRESQSAIESTPRADTRNDVLPPLGGTRADVTVPPLDQSDTLVRELVRQLTSHPTAAAWLATNGLIRNFTVSLANVADDMSPERHLRVLRPAAQFTVSQQGGAPVIDPASYHRYDSVAAAAASIDPAGAARLYATLKPRIEEAYRDLGHPDGNVDLAVEQAVVRILQTPAVDGPVRVQPDDKGIGYTYSDPRLESLGPVQKQLLRMGPENVRTIQRSLRAIAIELGIPASRLPAPGTR
jgi:hypothetical protein